MIVEQAMLHVRSGEDAAFRVALEQARPLIAASPGFRRMAVHPAAERDGLYLLLIEWDSIADHRDGFRQSERYARWRDLLHHHYDPMPIVTYFGDAL